MDDLERLLGSIVRRRLAAAAFSGYGVDDMMGVAHVAACEAKLSWDPEGGRSLSSWIAMCVDFDLLDFLRKQSAPVEYEDCEAADTTPIDTVCAVRRMLTALQAYLPFPEWDLIWLRHAEGYSTAEIATRMGLPETAVRQRLSRVQRKSVTFFDGLTIVGSEV